MSKQKETVETYRPTVRYDMKYKEYIEELFQSTTLDRNQLMRLALYVMGHTSEGLRIMEAFGKPDTTVPLPPWDLFSDWELWLGRTSNGEKEEAVKLALEPAKGISKPIKIHSLSYTIINQNKEAETVHVETTEGVQ